MISITAGCYRSSFAQVAQVITNNENSKSTSGRWSKRPENYFDFLLRFDVLTFFVANELQVIKIQQKV